MPRRGSGAASSMRPGRRQLVRMRFFKVPLHGGQAEEELNKLLVSSRVVSVDRQFVSDGEHSAWAVCVSLLDGQAKAPIRKGKVDYREILSEADFAVSAKLRALRKALADQEGVPAYGLFTNEQLANMVRNKVQSRAALAAIDGVGQARVAKYGGAFINVLNTGQETAASGTSHEA